MLHLRAPFSRWARPGNVALDAAAGKQ